MTLQIIYPFGSPSPDDMLILAAVVTTVTTLKDILQHNAKFNMNLQPQKAVSLATAGAGFWLGGSAGENYSIKYLDLSIICIYVTCQKYIVTNVTYAPKFLENISHIQLTVFCYFSAIL